MAMMRRAASSPSHLRRARANVRCRCSPERARIACPSNERRGVALDFDYDHLGRLTTPRAHAPRKRGRELVHFGEGLQVRRGRIGMAGDRADVRQSREQHEAVLDRLRRVSRLRQVLRRNEADTECHVQGRARDPDRCRLGFALALARFFRRHRGGVRRRGARRYEYGPFSNLALVTTFRTAAPATNRNASRL